MSEDFKFAARTPAVELSRGEPMASRKQLTSVLGEFAQTMTTDFPIQAILDRLVERIVDVLPVTGAGVTLISNGVQPRYVAASNAAAL